MTLVVYPVVIQNGSLNWMRQENAFLPRPM